MSIHPSSFINHHSNDHNPIEGSSILSTNHNLYHKE